MELQESLLNDEDQVPHTSKQIKRKTEKGQGMVEGYPYYFKVVLKSWIFFFPADEPVKDNQMENISSILLRNYDTKLYGEDDTSQPTSRTAPIIPKEATRKKKKRKRLILWLIRLVHRLIIIMKNQDLIPR